MEIGNFDLVWSTVPAENFSYNITTEDLSEDGETGQVLRYSVKWTILLICAYSAIFLVGIVGNTMVVVVLILRPQRKKVTVTDTFILNLACADLLVNIFCVGPTLLSNIFISWILGPFMCKAVPYVQGVSVCASVYSLVAISLDRFLAIIYNTQLPRGLSRVQARIIVASIWIAAATIASPWTQVFSLSEKDGYTFCVEAWGSPMANKLYFIIGNLILCYAFPLTLVIASNGLIWLRVANRKIPNEIASTTSIQRLHKKTRHGVLRMLTVVTLTFLVSWLPLYVIFLAAKMEWHIPETADGLIPFAQWLGESNSSCNPILYAFLNRKFRDSFRSLISCHSPVQSQQGRSNAKEGDVSLSMNNSTLDISQSQTISYRQTKRNTFRYPIVRV